MTLETKAREPQNNFYAGVKDDKDFRVDINGAPFDHRPSLDIIPHSPTGFAWGYWGSGPAQLALAILQREGCTDEEAIRYYQNFKSQMIATLNMEETWQITSMDVRQWLSNNGLEL